jgi:hypothetical protein
VSVTTEGMGSCGKVLAVMWQIGELERNFMIMQTSSGAGENIIGDYKLDFLKLKQSCIKIIVVFLTKCIAELLGGCGSMRSCDGVCPKFLIWFSMASRITASVIDSKSTLPSYVR